MFTTVIATAAGAASWSLTEWVTHNYLGHKLAKNRNFFAVEHVRHHATTTYFAPHWKKALAATIVGGAILPVAATIAGPKLGAAYTAGFVGAYLGYEMLHRLAHVSGPRTRYGRWMRKHHFHHHFKRPNMNHGVTSPLWDWAFGSYDAPDKVRVPTRHAMPWLLDPQTGEVWPELRDDYELHHKGHPPKAEQPAATPTHSAKAA